MMLQDFYITCLGLEVLSMFDIYFFIENKIDGESLVTLIGVVPGLDCLKGFVPKIGIRIKVYHHINYDEENSKVSFHE